MADIELVIKITEKTYNAITHTEFDANLVVDKMRKAIVNGTPLPKGHGRLIDADAYAKKYDTNINGRIGEEYVVAPTIIEADKENDV